MRELIAFCSLILDDVPENLGMMARSGIPLKPNFPKFDSNCGEARLTVDVVNEWLCFDGIRFEETSAAFKDNIMDQMIILPGLCEWIHNGLASSLALYTLQLFHLGLCNLCY